VRGFRLNLQDAVVDMRVLHVTRTYFPDSQGGIEEVIRQISLNTQQFGIESRVFALSKNPLPKVIQRLEGEVFRLPLSFEIASCGVSFGALSQFKKIAEWADVIHYHFPWPFADVLHLLSTGGKKSIVTYHSDIIRQKKLLLLYRSLMFYFLDRVDAIVATSEHYVSGSDVLNRYTEKLKIIPIGIDEDRYPKPSNNLIMSLRKKVGDDFFLFIGTLRAYKGLKILLGALRNVELRCVIAGTGPLEKELKDYAKQMGLSNVQFLGTVSDEVKYGLLTLCRAVVFPSTLRSEAFGVTLVEGLMCSKPLISTELGTGTSYVNLNGETGIVIAHSDIESLRTAMLRLASDDKLANKMGNNARVRYKKLFTGRIMGKKYANLYLDIK